MNTINQEIKNNTFLKVISPIVEKIDSGKPSISISIFFHQTWQAVSLKVYNNMKIFFK